MGQSQSSAPGCSAIKIKKAFPISSSTTPQRCASYIASFLKRRSGQIPKTYSNYSWGIFPLVGSKWLLIYPFSSTLECQLSPNILPSPLSFRTVPEMHSWWQYSQWIPHMYQPPLQLGAIVPLIIRHWEVLLQSLLNLTDWTIVISGYPHCSNFPLLKKWGSNSSRHPKPLIS